jgi:hypothetical protein
MFMSVLLIIIGSLVLLFPRRAGELDRRYQRLMSRGALEADQVESETVSLWGAVGFLILGALLGNLWVAERAGAFLLAPAFAGAVTALAALCSLKWKGARPFVAVLGFVTVGLLLISHP